MSTKAQIESCIKNAVSAFNAAIPNGCEITSRVEFEIFSSGKYEEHLREVTERLGAVEKEYCDKTVAEVVIGGSGIAIVIYSRRFPDGLQGELAIAHELGHILDAIANEEIHTVLRIADSFHMPNPFSIGGALWSEFIASVIENYVYFDREFLADAFDYNRYITRLLDDAIHRKTFDVPWLGIYFAALLSDKESLALQEECMTPLIGVMNCSDEEVDKLLDISDILIDQLDEQMPFWKISKERLIDLGNRISNLCDLLFAEGVNGT